MPIVGTRVFCVTYSFLRKFLDAVKRQKGEAESLAQEAALILNQLVRSLDVLGWNRNRPRNRNF